MRCQWSCWWRKGLSQCPQSHFAVVVSFYFLRFDLTADCPGARLSIMVRTAQSHMKWSATPRCECAAFGLAKKFSAWLLRDLICHAIFSSCALMHFWCVILAYLRRQFSRKTSLVFIVTFFVGSCHCPSARLLLLHWAGCQSAHGLLQTEFVSTLLIATWAQQKFPEWCRSPWPYARPVGSRGSETIEVFVQQ